MEGAREGATKGGRKIPLKHVQRPLSDNTACDVHMPEVYFAYDASVLLSILCYFYLKQLLT